MQNLGQGINKINKLQLKNCSNIIANKSDLNKKNKSDLLDSFKHYFVKILINNYRTYRLRKKFSILAYKVKAINKINRIMSFVLFRKIVLKILTRLKHIQILFRFYLYKRKLITEFTIMKKFKQIKIKLFFTYFRLKAKSSRIRRLKINKKWKNIKFKLYQTLKTIFKNLHTQLEETRQSSAVKYYNKKIIFKLFFLLIKI